MFHTLNIKTFRCFENQQIVLGKYLTVLAGRNSTGKSTVLGMLGNAAELKKKMVATYFSKPFRADFGELFKGSLQYDKTGSDKYRISVSDDNGAEIDYRLFRVTWQDKAKRFRIIPYKLATTISKKTDAKLEIPVYYLGLSRLFPIGEAESVTKTKLKFDSDEHKKWFEDNYARILSLYDPIREVSGATIGNFDGKFAIGISTDKYDYLSNSSGQDNLGQILFALLSFRRYREVCEVTNQKGGLLLIDEFDSTLHPSAQNSLIDLIISEAKSMGIQVVITTHSISLLAHLQNKYKHNNNSSNNIHNVELYYFTTQNRFLEIKRNLEFCSIENDLMVQSMAQNRKKIKIYSEDDEARWFLKKLLNPYLSQVEILDVSLGCCELLRLFKADQVYFGNVLMVLDGDASDKEIENILSKNLIERKRNIIKLPGTVRPEQVFCEYLDNLGSTHAYWTTAESVNFNWDSFKAHDPNSPDYAEYSKPRDKYKQWFKDHKDVFDETQIYSSWAEDNPSVVETFIQEFITSFNSVAERLSMPSIKPS